MATMATTNTGSNSEVPFCTVANAAFALAFAAPAPFALEFASRACQFWILDWCSGVRDSGARNPLQNPGQPGDQDHQYTRRTT